MLNTNSMEYLNKIELRGIVGSVRLIDMGGTKVAKLTIATNVAYRSSEGYPVIETTWHNVTAYEGRCNLPLEELHKGDKVYVTGRMRNQRYTTASGEDRTVAEVYAKEIEVYGNDEPIRFQEL